MEGPETISSVILEPVGGATIGALVPPDGYLSLVRKICDRFGNQIDEIIELLKKTFVQILESGLRNAN